MAALRFSRRAETDLFDIGTYTLERWGAKQAGSYLDDLEASCTMLAENPALGRPCDDVRSGLRRMEHGKHVIFYRPQKGGGISVARVLHQRMLPEAHGIDDDGDGGA